MSAAGKSVIARRLYEKLEVDNPATVLVDGDDGRSMLDGPGQTDFTVEGRRANSERIRSLCAWLDRQGIDVVCSILSIFPDAHSANRQNFSNYLEVYVRAPFEVLVDRHPADLYRSALRGETADVVGVDITFPEPDNPDVVIDNGDPPIDLDEAVEMIQAAMTLQVGR